MKFTKESLHQLIAEEIENYLNEQSEQGDRAMNILRKYFTDEKTFKAFQDLRKKYPEEELRDPAPLPPGEEEQYPAADPDAVLGPPLPGFNLDIDDDEAEPSLAPTQEIPHLKRTPIGFKPRRSPQTMIKSLDKK